MTRPLCIPGALVALPLRSRRARPLDGFWVRGRRPRSTLAVFVHGMHSNFYRSTFKKALMLEAPRAGLDLLLFNNRGAELDTNTERFTDCVEDLDAALRWARGRGYRRVVLIGHSTGCQKITWYQLRRRHPAVRGLVLAALGDDLAITRRELGRRYRSWLARARRLAARGRGGQPLPAVCKRFTARRFLSVADPDALEAGLFNFGGPLRRFARLRLPVLAVFPAREQYAVLPVAEMARRLRRARPDCAVSVVPRADHSFRGAEVRAARLILAWAAAAAAQPPAPA